MLEPEEDIVPKEFIGCKVEWKDPALDPTTTQVWGGEGSRGR